MALAPPGESGSQIGRGGMDGKSGGKSGSAAKEKVAA
jgi:hypothetical protein